MLVYLDLLLRLDLQGEYASCGSPISIRFFCSIVLYQESTSAEECVSHAQLFSRKIDSKFIELFIYPFIRSNSLFRYFLFVTYILINNEC